MTITVRIGQTDDLHRVLTYTDDVNLLPESTQQKLLTHIKIHRGHNLKEL